jgi:hypothetical protein
VAPETSTTSIRLTEQDRANAAAIIRSGAATDIASAIRVGMAVATTLLRLSPMAWRELRDATVIEPIAARERKKGRKR